MLRELPTEIVVDGGNVFHPKPYYYADDETGLIWSTHLQDWIKARKCQGDYLRVNLMCEEKQQPFLVHRLIYETFNGPIPQGLQVNHINENKEDNRLANLNLMTPSQNINHGTRNARVSQAMTNGKLSKQVYQYTTELELVEIHPSTCEAGRKGFDQANISACCNGKRKTHRGFIWSYVPL